MTKVTGTFVWVELMTSDTRAAQTFYSDVIGWNMVDSGLTDRSYTIILAGETGIGGLMALPPLAKDNGAPPAWMGYVGVDDVDAFATRVTAAGGSICHAAEDIPGVGRFAVVADPGGAAFVLFKGMSGQTPAPVAPNTPGHVGWHELMAADGPKAFEFYSGLFGWTKDTAMDMGAMGVYQLFATGGPAVGGMMTKVPECPMPFWLYYFNVEAIDAAAARVTKAGGKIFNGPMEVPGGSWIVQCHDPQGAMFAMVAPKR